MSALPNPGALNPGVSRREVFAWAMYDFANSGYTTVVLTAVFNAYFVSVVAGGAPWATFAWTAVLAVSYAMVMVAGPVVGAFADVSGKKKKLLFMVTAGCIVSTALLAAAGPGMLWWAAIMVIVSNFCYALGENLIAAFLPELARPEALGKVSGWGWSLGYMGGLLALGLSLAWIMRAEAHGVKASEAVGATMLITAAVFAVAASVTFIWLKERAVPSQATAGARAALARLLETAREAAHYRDLFLVFACGTLYQAGVATVIALAAIYAQEVMGFKTTDTLFLVLVVNITAAIGAFVFGYLQDHVGKITALRWTLYGWIMMVVCAWFATTPGVFWIAANIAGICMGSSQSAGRALVAYFAPPARVAEFFGLWGVAVRLAAILGPLTYGAVAWISGGNHRLAMLLTGVFFASALVILAYVKEGRGRDAALAAKTSSRA
jgi:UMF1 family MFS transporter